MVGLSDIPCLGVAVQRFSEYIVDAITRGLRYSLCYKTVVNQLNSEIEKVKTEEVRVSRKVDAAKSHGEIIDEHVLKWQQDVVNMKSLAEELSEQTTSCTCFKVLRIPNLVSRFRLGRKAAHQSENVADLTVSGRELVANEVGYLPPVENLPISNTTYQDFVSREVAYGKLWEALVNENGDSVIGIYGMPGVGKTRMMEQAWVDAKDKNIFDKVARVNVSEKFDVIGLQKKLAASLGCHLVSEDNEQERASQLKRSLMNGGKTMVVLDDVWDVIPLNSIGIPKGCKILLTSRKKDVCLRYNCQDPIEIETLTDVEAWEMFQSRVGGSSEIGKLNDASLAVEVCKRCAGLPLAIDAVGNALKCATENLWKDALRRLENHKFKEIKGIDTQVYACIKLSFEMLDVEARTCLFLCSFFGEDEDIKIHFLLNLATGCHLLDREVNIFAVIDILKSSSLLLHDEYEETVKLHDVIIQISRCSGSKYLFSATAAKCLKQLQQLDVQFCSEIEEIIRSEGGITAEGEVICFPNLKELNLLRLPRLTNFSSHKVAFPKMQEMKLEYLNSCFSLQKIELGLYDSPPTLHTLCIKFDGQEVSELPLQWPHQLQNIEDLELSYCWWTGDSIFNGTLFSGRLKSLNIRTCGVTSLFRYSSLASFQQLQFLSLSDCPLLEGIAWADEPDLFNNGDKTTILLPRLREIELVNLPELKNCGIFSCSMPTLERVRIDCCGFSTLFTSSTFKSLKKLSSLKVSRCPVLENILEDEMHDQAPKDTISLLCLEYITLDSLTSLKSFSRSSIHAFNMPVLKRVQINDCPRMHTFSLCEVIMPGVKVYTLYHSYSNVSDLNRSVREEVYGREEKSNGESSDGE